MTPADKRVMELLERWLTSIELHLKYADLDDVSYQQMQPWPRHERPARWILELAQQKVLSLQTLCKAHRSNDDPSFAESLELMCFLANLVGAQHIQRFIPLALPERETKPDTGMHRALQTGSMSARIPVPPAAASATPPQAPAAKTPVVPVTAAPRAASPGVATQPPSSVVITPAAPVTVPTPTPPVLQPQPASPPRPSPPAPAAKVIPLSSAIASTKPVDETDRTREMPRLRPSRQRHQATAKSVEPRKLNVKTAATKPQTASNEHADEVVIADAVRLLKWGRQWHEIAELIARMAERPSIGEVRKILRSHKPVIEQQLEA